MSSRGEITVCIPMEAFHELLQKACPLLLKSEYSMGIPYISGDYLEVEVAYDDSGAGHPDDWYPTPRATIEWKKKDAVYEMVKKVLDEHRNKS